jgi:hypothetical protein
MQLPISETPNFIFNFTFFTIEGGADQLMFHTPEALGFSHNYGTVLACYQLLILVDMPQPMVLDNRLRKLVH